MTLLAFWCIAWLIGIWLSSLLAFPLYVWAGGALIALLVATLARSYQARLFLSCVSVLALGGARLSLAQPHFDENALVRYNDRNEATLVGIIAAEPDVRDDRVYYDLDAQTLEGQEGGAFAVHGTVRIRADRYPVYDYGDQITVQGRLETPPVWDDFNYREYLALKGIHSYIAHPHLERLASGGGSAWKRTMLAFKSRARETIAHILPEPEASLLIGILLGIESTIPRDLMNAFSRTSATHVIVISGFNIAIVAALLMATAGWLLPDRRLAAFVAILGVVAYTVFVGADAAVVRAAIMGTIIVFGVIVGRQGVALNSLAVAVLVMAVLNPFVLWDVGFQLSVVATLGLIVYGGRLERFLQRAFERRLSQERTRWVVKWLSEILLLTLAAQILTTPLILKHFGQLSLVSLLTNALILPVQPLVMFFGGAATLAGLAFQPLGQILAWGAYPWLTWTIRVVEWTAGIPYAAVSFKLSDLQLLGVFALITGVTALALVSPERRQAFWQGLRDRVPLKAALGGTALLTAVAWFAVLQLPDGKLKVVFLDVGQGDAIYIQTPAGVQILVDGGPEGSLLLSELGRQMPFWDRNLDMVVLTHPDSDHLTGLISALERYDVGGVIAREPLPETGLSDAWRTALVPEGAELIRGEAGMRVEMSDGVTLEVLHPGPDSVTADDDDTNNDSIVMRLIYEDVAVLLPGDIEAEVEKELVRSGTYLRSTVLKVPHHGSNTSSCQAFLDAVSPQAAVISVGADNDYRLPSGETMMRLGEIPLVYRTDENGTVSITSDGHRLWIETER